MSEQCFNRGNLTVSLKWRTNCMPMKVVWGKTKRKKKRSVMLKKSSTVLGQSEYSDAVDRCTSSKTYEDKKNLIKLEFELEKQGSGLGPCELQLVKEGYKCRVAMEHSRMMFRDRLKINVVKKRKLLKFTNGCHFS